MSNWGEGNLPDFVDLLSGCTVTSSQFGQGTKYVTVQQLYYGNTIDVYSSPSVKISEYQIERYKLLEGDILIGKSSVKLEGIGYPALFKSVREDVIYSNFTVRIRRKSLIDQNYLFYWLRGESSRKWIISQAQKSALTNINQNIINRFPVKFPKDIRVQRKLAQILSSVDNGIEKTEALIEKYQQIKAGLMHDLFTRGIGADGKLRPPREEAPELYQLTPIGWIPKGWECSKLIKKAKIGTPHLRTGPFGSSLKGEHWVENGHPVITIGALGEGCFNESELLFISEFDANRLIDFQMKKGDVVFSRVADVGRSAVIDEENVGWVMSSNLMRISLDRELVNSRYLQYKLSFDSRLKMQIRCKVNSGGREVANSEILNALYFAWPPIVEQNEIVYRANLLSHLIECETKKLTKLAQEKSGLMHDLLTGKVQLTIPSAEAAHV